MSIFDSPRAWAIAGVFGIVAGLAQPASAVQYTFECITFNSASNCSDGEAQLFMDVTENAGDATKVDFLFTNVGSEDMSITDIYFDDMAGLFTDAAMVFTASSGVSFSEGARPRDLPGGNTIGFSADRAADSDSPVQPNGVNPGESLTITLMLAMMNTFQDVIDALALGGQDGGVDGSLRVGLHVQGFGDGGSESFVSVPVPASLGLFLSALVGMGLLGRRRRSLA